MHQRFQIFTHAVTSAIGTLRGPLHGGANEAASAMLSQWNDPDVAEAELLKMLATKATRDGFWTCSLY